MSRRRIIRGAEDEVIQEAEVVMRWSKKRIVIATVLVFFLITGGIYAITLLSRNPDVLGAKTTFDNSPEIKIPDKKKIQDTLDAAKDELSNINAKNIISSQPQLQKIINDLTNLTGSSSSAKNLICDSLCK